METTIHQSVQGSYAIDERRSGGKLIYVLIRKVEEVVKMRQFHTNKNNLKLKQQNKQIEAQNTEHNEHKSHSPNITIANAHSEK